MSRLDPEAADAERRQRILSVARQIINESGDFELPMRELAKRARVSLRAPYDLFGSKAGVTQAILLEDIEVFSRRFTKRRVPHPLDLIFERMRQGIDFYKTRQPFYRALSRYGAASVANPEYDPERLGLDHVASICRDLKAGGFLQATVDDFQLAWSHNDLFYSAMRHWAFNDYDIEIAHLRMAFGTALMFAGAVSDPHIKRMRDRASLHGRKLAIAARTVKFS